MTEKERLYLTMICNKAQVTTDNYVMSVTLPVNGQDERNQICKELETAGYISNVVVHGRDKVGCQVDSFAFEAIQNRG